MRWRDYVDSLAFEVNGLKGYGGPAQDEQDLLIFDRQDLKTVKIREQRAWFSGDDGALLNFYARNAAIDFHLEPFYWKNKRAYFWSESSRETDYKRVTSGLHPAIIWTIINIIGMPQWSDPSCRLPDILESDGFDETFHDEMLPGTCSEGAGCFRISWDLDSCDHPMIDFVTAENVDFIRKGKRVIGVVFKDWYKDRNNVRYLVAEIRRTMMVKGDDGKPVPHLIISTRAFRVSEGDDTQLIEIMGFRSIPELAGISDDVDISNCSDLLAVPTWFWKDPEGILDGKPMLAEKTSLLDDLDQSLSQSGNADRATTIQRVYDTQFLDRDPVTQMPIRPDKFNLKYTYSDSGPTADANGGIRNTVPIQIVQPSVNFDQYSSEQMNIVTHILQGIVSPATMGIDVSRKDNANAQREKEKVTVFTRNGMVHHLENMLRSLGRQTLIVDDYLHTGKFDFSGHGDVRVKFSEFADTSFEGRATIMTQMMGGNCISPELFVRKLYLDTLTEEEEATEIEWLNSHFSAEAQQQAMLGGAAGEGNAEGDWLPENMGISPDGMDGGGLPPAEPGPAGPGAVDEKPGGNPQ